MTQYGTVITLLHVSANSMEWWFFHDGLKQNEIFGNKFMPFAGCSFWTVFQKRHNYFF